MTEAHARLTLNESVFLGVFRMVLGSSAAILLPKLLSFHKHLDLEFLKTLITNSLMLGEADWPSGRMILQLQKCRSPISVPCVSSWSVD